MILLIRRLLLLAITRPDHPLQAWRTVNVSNQGEHQS